MYILQSGLARPRVFVGRGPHLRVSLSPQALPAEVAASTSRQRGHASASPGLAEPHSNPTASIPAPLLIPPGARLTPTHAVPSAWNSVPSPGSA